MTKWLLSGVFLACHHGPEHASGDPATVTLPPAAMSAPARATVVTVIDAGRPASIVWRVLRHVYVQDDAGVPRDMSVTVQLEIPGKAIGPFTFGEPGCALGTETDDKHVVAGLTCYYAGGGDYVEIHEKKPGEYVVLTYFQEEGYADEPRAPKQGLRTLGTFQMTAAPTEALVAADGGRYSAYE